MFLEDHICSYITNIFEIAVYKKYPNQVKEKALNPILGGNKVKKKPIPFRLSKNFFNVEVQ